MESICKMFEHRMLFDGFQSVPQLVSKSLSKFSIPSLNTSMRMGL